MASYLVTCTFDLKNATRSDYDSAYADLRTIGLKKVVVADQGQEVVAPTTMTIGKFTGHSAGAVADAVVNQVRTAFQKRRFSSEVFVVAAGDWGWRADTT